MRVGAAEKPRVLLVDDSDDIRLLLRVLLDRTGSFEVSGEAANGVEAVDLAETIQPDLVVLDVAMPQMGGLQAIAELRRVAPGARLVLLSGFDTSDVAESALAHGADAYIYKAVPPEELVAKLAAVVGVGSTNVDDDAAVDWAEVALRDAQASLQGAFDDAAIGLAVLSLDGKIVTVNDALCRILGATREQLIGRAALEWIHIDDAPEAIAQQERMQSGESHAEFLRARVHRADGTPMWVERQRSLVRDKMGRALFALAQVRDISKLKLAEDALRASEQKFQAGFDNAPVGMALIGLDGRLTRINEAFCLFLRRPAPELIGALVTDLTLPDDHALFTQVMSELILGTRDSYSGEHRLHRSDGNIVHALASAVLVRDADNNPVEVFAQVVDITERKRAEDELTHLAERDPLTGLLNRRRFLEELARHELLYARHGTPCAVIMFDLDGFKRVNDELGHGAGDDVLRIVAECLLHRLRSTDVIARFGGDEFVVLLPHTTAEAADAVGRDLVELIRTAANQAHKPSVPLDVSAGLAMIDNEQVDHVMLRADRAMYERKRAGGGFHSDD